MKNLRIILNSPHIHLALTTATCIIVLTFVSRRMLPEPVGYIPVAIPPFVATLFESLKSKYKTSRFTRTVYGILAIFLSTLIVIIWHMF
jgi:predicted histidine transporter YuiF (NhaC family)